MKSKRSLSAGLYVWTRDIHLYIGLFLIPYILVFAVSTILLNHSWKATPHVEKRSVPVRIADGVDPIEQAPDVLRQLNISGEVNIGRGSVRNNVLGFGVVRPGRRSVIRIDLATKQAEVEEIKTGTLDALRFLHFMPGPHKVLGMNWIMMKIWGWLADTTVYAVLFLSVSGIYMWTVIKAERRAGLIMLGAGVFCFFGLVLSLFYA